MNDGGFQAILVERSPATYRIEHDRLIGDDTIGGIAVLVASVDLPIVLGGVARTGLTVDEQGRDLTLDAQVVREKTVGRASWLHHTAF